MSLGYSYSKHNGFNGKEEISNFFLGHIREEAHEVIASNKPITIYVKTSVNIPFGEEAKKSVLAVVSGLAVKLEFGNKGGVDLITISPM
jgi:hypothetical protein